MSDSIIQSYAEINTLKVFKQIGFGIHGQVFLLAEETGGNFFVAKIFGDECFYQRELEVYHRLREHDISSIGICNVPRFVDTDPERLIIRMTLVQRPFCLDFASAYLDELPAYFPPFDQNWHQEKENQFGSDKWPEVLSVVRELESLGIFQTDVSPSNIAL